jgi:L-seryl-tRNA(Ser) seleniumtransferase
LAALEATLRCYRDPAAARRTIPVLAMLTEPAASLAERAGALAGAIPAGFQPTLKPGQSAVGGGSFPDAPLPTTVVTLHPGARGANALALELRLGDPSVLARVEADRVVLDPRTIPTERFPAIAASLGRLAP